MTSQYGRCTSKTRDTNQSAGPHILFSALLLKLCELIFVTLVAYFFSYSTSYESLKYSGRT